jgi:hypothetical protein
VQPTTPLTAMRPPQLWLMRCAGSPHTCCLTSSVMSFTASGQQGLRGRLQLRGLAVAKHTCGFPSVQPKTPLTVTLTGSLVAEASPRVHRIPACLTSSIMASPLFCRGPSAAGRHVHVCTYGAPRVGNNSLTVMLTVSIVAGALCDYTAYLLPDLCAHGPRQTAGAPLLLASTCTCTPMARRAWATRPLQTRSTSG